MIRQRQRVLIFGVSGFIGGHLATHLNESEQFDVLGWARTGSTSQTWRGPTKYGSFNELSKIQEILNEWNPDFIVSTISQSTPGRDLTEFSSQFENSIYPTIELARLTPKDTKLNLFFGSCEEYGNSQPPFLEEQNSKCFSPYGWAKISSKIAVEFITSQRELNVCWLRPFLTFGPHQRTSYFIPHVIQSCLAGKTVELTLCEQTRDFIYVNDLCRMIKIILENHSTAIGQTLNLCTGKPRNLRDVASIIQSKIGKGNLQFGALPYRLHEAMNFFGSTSRWNKLYGEFRETDFENALDETIKSYIHFR